MPRPHRRRRIECPPRFNKFKPAGIPARRLEQIELTVDEYEAIRLADYFDHDQLQASQRMGISRPTFARMIERARHKVACALVDGKALRIAGGSFDFVYTLHRCNACGELSQRRPVPALERCPDCGSEDVEDLSDQFPSDGKKNKPAEPET